MMNKGHEEITKLEQNNWHMEFNELMTRWKMYGNLLTAPSLFTAITCPERGPVILMVILELIQSTRFDLDTIYNNEKDLNNHSLE